MFLKRAKTHSIASQLIFLFTLATAFLLTSALGVFYWLVVRHAFEEDNDVLLDKVSALSAELKQSGDPKGLEPELKPAGGDEHVTYWLRVLDSSGHLVIETPGMENLLPDAVFPKAQGAEEVRPKDYRIKPYLFSLVSVIARGNRREYVIQLAQNRSGDERFQREFGALVAIVLVLALFVSVGVARTATRRGLRPLAEITRSFKRIGPTHLNERVAPIGWPPELQPLAEAFDEMLSRLEDSFARLSQFSADLAHELRTPIANIMGEAQVTLTRDRTSSEYREVIESTVAECEKLSRIVDNLLFLARAESAREQIEQTEFDGRAAIEKIANYYQPLAEERNITIRCVGAGTIAGDPVLFGRAISNLVENALRSTPSGGSINLSIAADHSLSKVSVSDTGMGIGSEHIGRVFDRFYRVDSSRSSPGTGLGLALVKSIAELHGGSVSIRSQVGHGTTVTLTLPNQALPAQPPPIK